MWLLIIVLAILALSAYDGYKKGFVRITLSFASIFITIAVVIIISPNVTALLKNNTDVFDIIYKNTDRFLSENNVFSGEKDDEALIDSVPVPDSVKDYLKKNNTDKKYEELSVGSTREMITDRVATLIFNAIVFLVLFIAVLIAVKMLIEFLDLVSKLPLLKEVNVLAGVALGFAQGILVVWIFFTAITIFSNTDFAKMMFEQINANPILTFINDNNYVLKLLMSLMK
ncbi:MAG: CvpA family protein [Lachnospiraceae bacterium]|nr:CvpA family protein [Lachnospira sp.]MBR6697257.1 CvpA family protein [Lachnospiraceae bacterium]